MSVRRLSQSFLSTRGRGKGSTFVAGYGFGVDEMDLLQRVTVGAGGTASIVFSSIPQTYQHLQIRVAALGAAAVHGDLQMNGDTGNNYAAHGLYGTGSTVVADAGASRANIYSVVRLLSDTAPAVSFIEVLDYTSTSKNKVVRTVRGCETNSSGEVSLMSGVRISTAAVTSIQITGRSGNFAQHSVFSLYGVVG